MNDEKTPGLQLPLPHPGNLLQEDVLRLRAALLDVDAAMGAMVQDLQDKIGWQEHQAAIENLQGAIANLNTTVGYLSGNKVATVNGLAGPAVILRPADLQGAGVSLTRDAQGRISTMQRTVDGKQETTTITRSEAGLITQAQIAFNGKTRTETYTRDGTGRISAVDVATT